MSTIGDQPPPDDIPPPRKSTLELKKIIHKLSSKHELSEYVVQLTAFHADHLNDLLSELRERLLLQGLDDDDLFAIHEFLNVTFDGELMKIANKALTQKRAGILQEYVEN